MMRIKQEITLFQLIFFLYLVCTFYYQAKASFQLDTHKNGCEHSTSINDCNLR